MPRRKFAPLPGNGYLVLSFVDYANRTSLHQRYSVQTELFRAIRDLKLVAKSNGYKLLEVGTEGCDYDIYDDAMQPAAAMRVYGLSKPNSVAANEEGEVLDIGELTEPVRGKPGPKPRRNGNGQASIDEGVH